MVLTSSLSEYGAKGGVLIYLRLSYSHYRIPKLIILLTDRASSGVDFFSV